LTLPGGRELETVIHANALDGEVLQAIAKPDGTAFCNATATRIFQLLEAGGGVASAWHFRQEAIRLESDDGDDDNSSGIPAHAVEAQ